jgi:FkbH-like protein
MQTRIHMDWLPVDPAWSSRLDSARVLSDCAEVWKALVSLSKHDLDFVECARLDRAAQKLADTGRLPLQGLQRVRLALLGSSTLKHLIPGIRVAGLRRGLWFEVFEGDYGLYQQELLDPASKLYAFRPQVVCLALDAPHLLSLGQGDIENTLERLRSCWFLAKNSLSASVIQQTALPVIPDFFGNNEFRMTDSPQTTLLRLNRRLESAADADGVHLLTVDKYVAIEGLNVWHDPTLWFRAKQEVHPQVSTLYGDYLARLVAAQRGLSAKCLVLDLDNTLWGGLIGEDGLQGIVLGEGNAAGEAFLTFQRYALKLKERGVILAVCSKNDEANALLPFADHADMVLKRSDIACFVANWQDKASNLREIAISLNIGVDALVFVDDNPFERNLVREELPEVSAPEMPEDPAFYIRCLSRAGYFEGLALTEEDHARADQYRVNEQRESLRQSSTDMQSYLRGMQMEMIWKPFDELGLQRIVQLINKTNQFNLTTRRHSEEDVRKLLNNSRVRTWQIRLKDRFGDNGVIAILICLQNEQGDLVIDTWLMSCRVLGRQVEEASLDILVEEARAIGADAIIGDYKPTAKNGMVQDLYARLGFNHLHTDGEGNSRWQLNVNAYKPRKTHITVLESVHAAT